MLSLHHLIRSCKNHNAEDFTTYAKLLQRRINFFYVTLNETTTTYNRTRRRDIYSESVPFLVHKFIWEMNMINTVNISCSLTCALQIFNSFSLQNIFCTKLKPLTTFLFQMRISLLNVVIYILILKKIKIINVILEEKINNSDRFTDMRSFQEYGFSTERVFLLILVKYKYDFKLFI